MNIEALFTLPVGTRFETSGPVVTRDLIRSASDLCGFAKAPHIVGERSLLSLSLGLDEGACLCGAGTLCLMNAALERAIAIDEQYDVLSFKQDAVFTAPNLEGGEMSFSFVVIEAKRSVFPPRSTGKKVPMSRIVLECEAWNSRVGRILGKPVLKATWTLGYVAMAHV